MNFYDAQYHCLQVGYVLSWSGDTFVIASDGKVILQTKNWGDVLEFVSKLH